MKQLLTFVLLTASFYLSAQLDNETYNLRHNARPMREGNEITGNENLVTIITETVYNAVPDGYHVTYTTSFIGTSVEDVENRMNRKTDQLAEKVKAQKLTTHRAAVDVVALDPVFDFNTGDESTPSGYKVTQNITFNVPDIGKIGALSKIFMDFGIYDMINAEAYLLNAKPIYDSLNAKTIVLLNQKKKLCEDVEISLSGGVAEVTNYKEVFYPSERYLKAYIQNPSFYKHHITQNSTLSLSRRVDVDNYYDLNLNDADFVFNAGNDVPCIQVYYRLVYTYAKAQKEEVIREEIRKEFEAREKQLFILDSEGNLKKVQ